ncbi:AzlD domain-containing protein [Corynebacterium zhongnanshanii]|uniref:branched-chain amino acid transporter permease n=1 Tax=Corynebacterium TaxID=1716 RepID=UPI0031450276
MFTANDHTTAPGLLAEQTVEQPMNVGEHGLPLGVTVGDVGAVLIPVFIVTLLLRALPFAALSKLRDSAIVAWLGLAMPVGVMTILVMYAVHSSGSEAGGYVVVGLALAFTVVLHLWRKSATLSILLGTAFYAVLVNFVF